MTGTDHHEDALITALSSPALPSELQGEEAVVAAMLDARSAGSVRPTGRRTRRVVSIAAVTVASLGVGGLVAAGPGVFFLPAVGRAPAVDPTTTVPPDEPQADDEVVPAPAGTVDPDDGSTTVTTSPIPSSAETGGQGGGADVGCGASVSEAAQSGEPGAAADVARSECGPPPGSPSATAPGQTGDKPSDTAPGHTGQTPSVTAPGQTGDNPSDTAPGQTGGNPSDTAPGQTGGNPSDTAPGRGGRP